MFPSQCAYSSLGLLGITPPEIRDEISSVPERQDVSDAHAVCASLRQQGFKQRWCCLRDRVCNICYLNSLHGDFAYDDGAAIKENKDITKKGPVLETIREIFTNDFWGQSLRRKA